MTPIAADSVAESVPVVLGVVLTLIAGYNYWHGSYGGAIVAGVGAIVTFVLVLLSG